MRDEELDIIAVKVSKHSHVAFLTSMAHAWLHADLFAKRMMRPAWETLISKHQLTA